MTDFYFNLFVAFVAIIFTYLLIHFWSRKIRRATNVVLLVGLSDSGKTALFTKITFNKPKKSVTSLKENKATIDELNLRLIDLPGAEQLRQRFWETYKGEAKHIIFVIDSTNTEEKIRDLSEYLYTLLSDEIIYTKALQFTIACNKQDLEGALKKSSVKSLLESELSAIKATKSGQLRKTSEEDTEEKDHLLKFDGNISFDSLKVNLIETSIHNVEQIIKTIL